MIDINDDKICKSKSARAVVKTVEETCELAKAGFEYVTGEYNDGGKIFRKRK